MSFLQLRSIVGKFVLLAFPTVITNAATNVQSGQADGNGNVTNAGGSAVTVRGFVWSSTTTNPTLSDSSVSSGSGTGSFTATMSGLAGSTLYYYRAYATNSIGTAYGDMVNFTTSAAVAGVAGPEWPVFTTRGKFWGWRYSS